MVAANVVKVVEISEVMSYCKLSDPGIDITVLYKYFVSFLRYVKRMM